MSIEATLERVSAIRQALADPAAMVGAAGKLTGGTEAPAAGAATGAASGASSFASALEQANASYATPTEEGSATRPARWRSPLCRCRRCSTARVLA